MLDKYDLVGGAISPSWKMMEFVNGKDDIPYMKWKIIHSCLKPPIRMDWTWFPLICMDWGASWVKEISTRNHVVFATKGEFCKFSGSHHPFSHHPILGLLRHGHPSHRGNLLQCVFLKPRGKFMKTIPKYDPLSHYGYLRWPWRMDYVDRCGQGTFRSPWKWWKWCGKSL